MAKTAFDEIDFEALYKLQKSASSQRVKSTQMWDDKAIHLNKNIHKGIYNDFVKNKISIEGVNSLLDVGCGPGTFALIFAPLVKEVFAFDFSPKMLEILDENLKYQNITNVRTANADIEGEWENIPICDVVLASRCIEVYELKKVLQNLNSHAKKAVYLTAKVGKSFMRDELLEILGRSVTPKPDYIYIVNTLYQMGINAKVDFVPKEDDKHCLPPQNADEYVKSISWSLENLSADEETRARDYFEKCRAKGEIPFFRNNAWALIYWEK